MMLLLIHPAVAMSMAPSLTRPTLPRVGRPLLSVALAPPTPAEYLCIGRSCQPLSSWFDGPAGRKRRLPTCALASRWRPLAARAFARDLRLRACSLSPGAVTIVGVVVNILLAAFKLGIGSISASAALVADGWHSLSDLASDLLCWIAVKSSRFEHICTLGIAAMLTVTVRALYASRWLAMARSYPKHADPRAELRWS